MINRREFLKLTSAAGAAVLAARFRFGRVLAQIPGGTLSPLDIPKYATPLLIPPVMPRAGVIKQKGGKQVDYYEISMRQFNQQILPASLPPTTVWGYGAVSGAGKRPLLIHNAPSLTIEAKWNRPVRVKWINELVGANGNYLPHLLPVDQTLHWANPPGGAMGRDMRPQPADAWFSTDKYTGPVPIVTHVHGAVGVGDESDGYAEAWYLPAAGDIPAGYATEGTWYNYFAGKASSKFGVAWGPGFATFQYPNAQRAATIWYHDHTLGMTRLNVYAGPAGFFLIRGGPAGDDAVLDSRFGTPAVLPGPAPKEGDKFPPNKTYYEIPIAIQDRSFNSDGSLFYPDTRNFFEEVPIDLFIPDTDISPIWNPEFFGNVIMVNGNTWPFQTVEQRRYRFRFLNGCQSRFLILDFSNIPGVEAWQIGNEGGFLAAPVNITANHGNQLLMGLAERADMIVDFTNVPVGNYVLGNVGPDEPFGGFPTPASDPATTGQIMQLNVVPAVAPDPTTPPMFLQLPAFVPLAGGLTRPLALIEHMSEFYNTPAEAMLGNVDTTAGTANMKMWAEPVSENPNVGDIEVWEFYNFTADAHPMHIHEVVFEVIDRQAITFDEVDMHPANIQLVPGTVRAAEPWENGYKDTVISYPGEVTRVRTQFNTPGQFVWHCHIVEHEDNEMMRPYRIGPPDPNAPG
jgi:FtsP/CotA-like multicopper oxidase with cupredoxin domain